MSTGQQIGCRTSSEQDYGQSVQYTDILTCFRKKDEIFSGIYKRDGRWAAFDKQKIIRAITRAFQAVGDGNSDSYCVFLAEEVIEECRRRFKSDPAVEQIQDIVEEILIRNNHPRVAKAYILYRAERTRAREMKGRLMQIYEDIAFNESKDSDTKRENANVNGDTAMGTMLKYGSEGAKQFYRMFVLNPAHAQAHDEGDIHIHDLDFLTLTTTCCQIDLVKLFKDGFGTGHGTLREPSDIASYSALACIAIQSNQNDQHGGQSIPNFDRAMALGVHKTFAKRYRLNLSRYLEAVGLEEALEVLEKTYTSLTEQGYVPTLEPNKDYASAECSALVSLGFAERTVSKAQAFALRHASWDTDRAVYQAMEAFIHNLNTMHSRAGAQTPFSSVNYGTDTTAEGRMVIRNLLLALEAGLGSGETPIFPIHIFRVKEGINYNFGDRNHDLFQLACRVSAKRLFPNFAFQDAPFNLRYYKEDHPETEIAYMGCRTRVISNIYEPGRAITYGRGNLSFTSINLPRLAILAQHNITGFFKELDKKLDLCVEQLLERLEIQSSKKVKNFPFLMGQGVWLDSDTLNLEEEVREILKHGTLSVGFIGLAETLMALMGKHHGESEAARKLGLSIVARMRRRMNDESRKHKLNFSLLATPAEGLSGRFTAIDRKRYGVIPGVTDRDFYTNSFHVPVYHKLTVAEKIRIEAPYHALTNAGHITYVELDGDTADNVEAFEKVVRCMKESGIGYGSVNHPVDRDPVCGYAGVIYERCPSCGREETLEQPFERIRRITGYLVGGLERFNNAKRAEVDERVIHGVASAAPAPVQ